MKMEKAKTGSRKKNLSTSTPVEVKAAPATVESKPKTNGLAEKPKEMAMKTGTTPAPVKPAPMEAKTASAPQPTKAAAPMASDFKAMSQASKTATIEAKIDVGFGNTLYLRGEGVKGADWNHGVPLKCVDGSTWQWSGEAADVAKVKLLLNDSVWAKGEDLLIKPGEKIQISPSF